MSASYTFTRIRIDFKLYLRWHLLFIIDCQQLCLNYFHLRYSCLEDRIVFRSINQLARSHSVRPYLFLKSYHLNLLEQFDQVPFVKFNLLNFHWLFETLGFLTEQRFHSYLNFDLFNWFVDNPPRVMKTKIKIEPFSPKSSLVSCLTCDLDFVRSDYLSGQYFTLSMKHSLLLIFR